MIRIGCSGWVYPDWEGTFYMRGERDSLSFYSDIFRTVEVNSTFYRPIGEKTLQSWARRVRGKDFSFALKVPGSITHEQLLRNTNSAASNLYRFQETHLALLESNGVLGPVLIQLPPYFRLDHTDKLVQLMSAIDTGKYSVFVEPRNKELYRNPEFRDEVNHAGGNVVSVDSPEISLRENLPLTGRASYIRLHGRNTESWFRRGVGKDEKYDYEYSHQELTGIRDIISKGPISGDEIFIYFNNHPSGKAPRNARSLMDMLGLSGPDSRQKKLV